MAGRFEQFLRERRYLQGVSERTAQWYAESFRSSSSHLKDSRYRQTVRGLTLLMN